MSDKLSDYASYELGNIEGFPEHVEARLVSGIDALEVKLSKMEPWWNRMSNEDIATELSATFDLGLETTRKIADWILAGETMSEHTHEWYITNFPWGAACKVKDCYAHLDIRQMQDQLNSYATLEAKPSKTERMMSDKLSERMHQFRVSPWKPKAPETVEEADLMWGQSLELFEIEVIALEAKLSKMEEWINQFAEMGRITEMQKQAALAGEEETSV